LFVNVLLRRTLTCILGLALLAPVAWASTPAPAQAAGVLPAAFTSPEDYVVYRSGKTLYGRLTTDSTWIKLATGVKKAIANPNLLLILTTTGTAFGKRLLSDAWTPLGTGVTDIAAGSGTLVLRKRTQLWLTNDLAVAPVLFGTSNRTPVVSGDFVTFRNSRKEVWARRSVGSDPWAKLASGVSGFDVAYDSSAGVAALVLRKGSAVWATSDVRTPLIRVGTFTRTPQVIGGRQLVVLDSKHKLWASDGTTGVWQLVDTKVDELDQASPRVEYRKGKRAFRWFSGSAPQQIADLPVRRLPQLSSYAHYFYVRNRKLQVLQFTWQTIATKVSWASFS
jgi:hypothetical protein